MANLKDEIEIELLLDQENLRPQSSSKAVEVRQ